MYPNHLNAPALNMDSTEPPLPLTACNAIAKRLASCHKSARDKALRSLAQWFAADSSAACSDDDLRWIWKGLFYCVWHADKHAVQLRLIDQLAALLLTLPHPSLSLRYLAAFFSTIRREWAGIDHLRLDKFYLLIRRFMHHFFLFLHSHSWDLNTTHDWVQVLVSNTLLAVDNYPAQGVNYHVSEIFLPELKGFLPVNKEVLDILFTPFLSVLRRSTDRVLVHKIKSSIFDCLLDNGMKLLTRRKGGAAADSGDDVQKLGEVAVLMGLSGKFMDMASSADTLQGNRKVLFPLHEAFLKLEKKWEESGFQCLLPVVLPPEGLDLVAPPAEAFAESKEKGSKKKSSKKKGKEKKTRTCKNALSDTKLTPKDAPEIEEENLCHDDGITDEDFASFDESVIANLQKQFERVAAEAGMTLIKAADGVGSTFNSVDNGKRRKRKRAKTKDKQSGKIVNSVDGEEVAGGSEMGKSDGRSAKRVRFAMKNNLVWQPHRPLPPESLRLPPSATPRGSALKKGVSPGPIKDSSSHRKPHGKVKTTRRKLMSVSPAVKRRHKLFAQSA